MCVMMKGEGGEPSSEGCKKVEGESPRDGRRGKGGGLVKKYKKHTFDHNRQRKKTEKGETKGRPPLGRRRRARQRRNEGVSVRHHRGARRLQRKTNAPNHTGLPAAAGGAEGSMAGRIGLGGEGGSSGGGLSSKGPEKSETSISQKRHMLVREVVCLTSQKCGCVCVSVSFCLLALSKGRKSIQAAQRAVDRGGSIEG